MIDQNKGRRLVNSFGYGRNASGGSTVVEGCRPQIYREETSGQFCFCKTQIARGEQRTQFCFVDCGLPAEPDSHPQP